MKEKKITKKVKTNEIDDIINELEDEQENND